ncbi:MAG: adenylyltransferase/cytidyltransferase family protein [Patescibacteria group bacterium]
MALKIPNLVLETDSKIKTLSELESEVARLKSSVPKCRDHRIVLTTGVFDLVHPGHIDYFNKARSFGDILVVSVVDDKFVRKEPGRPIFGQELRLKWLAALGVVDFVVLNGWYGPWKVMKAIKPDIYVKGYNLTPGLMKDIGTMRDLGGQTVLIPEIMHSTEIFKKIKSI